MSSHLLALACVGLSITAQCESAESAQPGTNGLLVRQVCAPCHGLEGNSTRGDVPSLAGQGEEYLSRQLRAFAAQGGRRANGIMGAIAVNLSPEEIRFASEYFAQQRLQISAAVAAPAQRAADGEKIFFAGIPEKGVASCASCHGTRGQGLPDVFPRIAGQHALYIAEQLLYFRAGSRADDPQAMMRHLAARLLDDEIQAVAIYAARLH